MNESQQSGKEQGPGGTEEERSGSAFSRQMIRAWSLCRPYLRLVKRLICRVAGYFCTFFFLARKHGLAEAMGSARFKVRILFRRAFRRWRTVKIPGPRLLEPFSVEGEGAPATGPTPDGACESRAARELSGPDFSGSIAVVLFHISAGSGAEPFVAHMGEHYQKLGWRVVLVLGGQIADAGVQSVGGSPPWAAVTIRDPALKEAAAAWKAALRDCPSLADCEELILSDDSVFGALTSHQPMHEAMRASDCDFWGVAETGTGKPGLQPCYPVEYIFRHFMDSGRDISASTCTGRRSGIWPATALRLPGKAPLIFPWAQCSGAAPKPCAPCWT